MIVLIDNYDSFTYNLVQMIERMGHEVRVFRNNKIDIAAIEELEPTELIISPGPCTPNEAGISVDTIQYFAPKIPVMGVCLGHQSVAAAFGGNVIRAERLMHGKSSLIYHDGRTIFEGLPNPFEAIRYHSLLVERHSLPECLEVSAWTDQGEIMGLRHREYRVEGVQFHPESIMTPDGPALMNRFLSVRRKTPMIQESIARVVTGKDLSQAEMESTMNEIMSGQATPAQIGAFITGLRMKGETVEEIAGAAKVMRAKAARISVKNHLLNIDRDDIQIDKETILDTCGTGGDGTNTFNVSTATAFVAAGGGIRVAKHGNRAVSSQCGSADVLEKLGVKLDIRKSDVEKCIGTVGIGFLFAPLFHGAMKYAAGPRKEIGLRTIFNLLGPLTNPAGATVQVLGVYDPGLTDKLAHVLEKLGTREAFVVCGEGTFDEISITSPTRVSHLKDGRIQTFDITPEDYGFKRAKPEEIRGGDAEENAHIIQRILSGEKGPKRDMVAFNAAAAFVVAGLAKDLHEGIQKAEEAIDSGKAKEKLDELILFSQSCESAV